MATQEYSFPHFPQVGAMLLKKLKSSSIFFSGISKALPPILDLNGKRVNAVSFAALVAFFKRNFKSRNRVVVGIPIPETRNNVRELSAVDFKLNLLLASRSFKFLVKFKNFRKKDLRRLNLFLAVFQFISPSFPFVYNKDIPQRNILWVSLSRNKSRRCSP